MNTVNFKKKEWLTNKKPNLLITSVGRRSYMVKYFKEALGDAGEVHVTNSNALSPAFNYADRATVSPLIYSDDYIPFLMDYISDNHIGALITLFDIDVPILSKARDEFMRAGCFPILPKEQIAKICNDKYKTSLWLNKHGIKTPKTFLSYFDCLEAIENGALSYPIIVKPRWGMGSIGIYKANNQRELQAATTLITGKISNTYLKYESLSEIDNATIFQECLAGQEYGMDIYNDLNGNYRGLSLRKKIAMRSGETDCAQVVPYDSAIKKLAMFISSITKHLGNMDIDLFLTDKEPYILEMNARFGGGYPFSHAAGVNMPSALIAWLRGKEPASSLFEARSFGFYQKDISMIRLNTLE